MVGRLFLLALASTGCRQLLGFEEATTIEDATPIDTSELLDSVIADVPVDVDTTTWSLRKLITIDGSQVTASIPKFPVLVRLAADTDLAVSARDDGFDLLFTAADGTTKLSHEIERFDPDTGALVAWVNLPSIGPNTDTQFYLYFGFPASPDQQNRTAVWDASYVGVWHLGETTGTLLADSTSFARNGTKVGASAPAPIAGMIGGGQSFAGLTDGISIGNDPILDIPAITFETWIQVSTCQNDVYRRIIDFTVAFESSWALAYPCTGAPGVNQNAVLLDLPDNTKVMTPTNSLSVDTAHHLVFQTNPTRFVIDGVERNATTAPFGLAQTNTNTIIGNREGSPDRAVIGTMDEVRISRVRRTPAYLAASHANQRPGSTFLTINAVEPAP